MPYCKWLESALQVTELMFCGLRGSGITHSKRPLRAVRNLKLLHVTFIHAAHINNLIWETNWLLNFEPPNKKECDIGDLK